MPAVSPKQLASISNAIGINLAKASKPPSLIDESAPTLLMPSCEGSLVKGAVPFEVRLTVLGHEVNQTCRALYSAILVDDVKCDTGEPIRILGELQIEWQVLDWRDPHNIDSKTGAHLRLAAPSWTSEFEAILPAPVPDLIVDLIETHAVALEAGRNSNP